MDRFKFIKFHRFICREKLISQFQPEEFWEVSATLKDFNHEEILFKLNRKKSDPLLKEDKAKKIEELVGSSSLEISEVTKKPTSVKPRIYNLNSPASC